METYRDSVFYEYAKIYADSLIDADGHIKTMKYLSFNIDNVNGGKILFDLYAQTGDERYKIAMDTLRKQMAEQPRTSEGGFWHKLRYPHQMWLDGIFMASPYLVQYGATFNEPALFDEATKQILLINSKTYDPATGLFITDGMKVANRNGQILKQVVLLIFGVAASDGMELLL